MPGTDDRVAVEFAFGQWRLVVSADIFDCEKRAVEVAQRYIEVVDPLHTTTSNLRFFAQPL
jgi:hypothetical protein